MSYCPCCGRCFGSLTAFRLHRVQAGDTVECRDPAVLGMQRDSHGWWHAERWEDPFGYRETRHDTWVWL